MIRSRTLHLFEDFFFNIIIIKNGFLNVARIIDSVANERTRFYSLQRGISLPWFQKVVCLQKHEVCLYTPNGFLQDRFSNILKHAFKTFRREQSRPPLTDETCSTHRHLINVHKHLPSLLNESILTPLTFLL